MYMTTKGNDILSKNSESALVMEMEEDLED